MIGIAPGNGEAYAVLWPNDYTESSFMLPLRVNAPIVVVLLRANILFGRLPRLTTGATFIPCYVRLLLSLTFCLVQVVMIR